MLAIRDAILRLLSEAGGEWVSFMQLHDALKGEGHVTARMGYDLITLRQSGHIEETRSESTFYRLLAMPCPWCDGDGFTERQRLQTRQWVSYTCALCWGDKTVSNEIFRRINTAQSHIDQRQSLGLSHEADAQRLGITLDQHFEREHGMPAPEFFNRCELAQRLGA